MSIFHRVTPSSFYLSKITRYENKNRSKEKKKKLVEGVQRGEKRSSLSAMIVTPINSIVSIVYQPRSNYSHYPSHPFVQASGLIPTNADSRPNSTPIRPQRFQSLSLDHWTIDPPSIRRRRRRRGGGRRISSLEEKRKVKSYSKRGTGRNPGEKQKKERERKILY